MMKKDALQHRWDEVHIFTRHEWGTFDFMAALVAAIKFKQNNMPTFLYIDPNSHAVEAEILAPALRDRVEQELNIKLSAKSLDALCTELREIAQAAEVYISEHFPTKVKAENNKQTWISGTKRVEREKITWLLEDKNQVIIQKSVLNALVLEMSGSATTAMNCLQKADVARWGQIEEYPTLSQTYCSMEAEVPMEAQWESPVDSNQYIQRTEKLEALGASKLGLPQYFKRDYIDNRMAVCSEVPKDFCKQAAEQEAWFKALLHLPEETSFANAKFTFFKREFFTNDIHYLLFGTGNTMIILGNASVPMSWRAPDQGIRSLEWVTQLFSTIVFQKAVKTLSLDKDKWSQASSELKGIELDLIIDKEIGVKRQQIVADLQTLQQHYTSLIENSQGDEDKLHALRTAQQEVAVIAGIAQLTESARDIIDEKLKEEKFTSRMSNNRTYWYVAFNEKLQQTIQALIKAYGLIQPKYEEQKPLISHILREVLKKYQAHLDSFANLNNVSGTYRIDLKNYERLAKTILELGKICGYSDRVKSIFEMLEHLIDVLLTQSQYDRAEFFITQLEELEPVRSQIPDVKERKASFRFQHRQTLKELDLLNKMVGPEGEDNAQQQEIAKKISAALKKIERHILPADDVKVLEESQEKLRSIETVLKLPLSFPVKTSEKPMEAAVPSGSALTPSSQLNKKKKKTKKKQQTSKKNTETTKERDLGSEKGSVLSNVKNLAIKLTQEKDEVEKKANVWSGEYAQAFKPLWQQIQACRQQNIAPDAAKVLEQQLIERGDKFQQELTKLKTALAADVTRIEKLQEQVASSALEAAVIDSLTETVRDQEALFEKRIEEKHALQALMQIPESLVKQQQSLAHSLHPKVDKGKAIIKPSAVEKKKQPLPKKAAKIAAPKTTPIKVKPVSTMPPVATAPVVKPALVEQIIIAHRSEKTLTLGSEGQSASGASPYTPGYAVMAPNRQANAKPWVKTAWSSAPEQPSANAAAFFENAEKSIRNDLRAIRQALIAMDIRDERSCKLFQESLTHYIDKAMVGLKEMVNWYEKDLSEGVVNFFNDKRNNLTHYRMDVLSLWQILFIATDLESYLQKLEAQTEKLTPSKMAALFPYTVDNYIPFHEGKKIETMTWGAWFTDFCEMHTHYNVLWQKIGGDLAKATPAEAAALEKMMVLMGNYLRYLQASALDKKTVDPQAQILWKDLLQLLSAACFNMSINPQDNMYTWLIQLRNEAYHNLQGADQAVAKFRLFMPKLANIDFTKSTLIPRGSVREPEHGVRMKM